MKHEELVEFLKGSKLTATDQTALKAVELYPYWRAGIDVKVGDRYQYNGNLYKCVTAHITQENWRPSLDTSSMWTVINIEHAGTIEDPIPAVKGMEYTKGLHYLDNEEIYLMNREGMTDGETVTLAFLPSELVGQYFEKVEK